MSSESPAVILYSSDGYELAVVPGSALPAQPRAILIDGSDGTNARTLLVDSSGRPVVVGAGTAGTAVGGVITIQGIAGGTAVPISGTVTAVNDSVGTDGAAALGSDTQVGGKVTTAAPTYTTGNLNALSLTTLGGLRIDGVYAVGTANATAADIGISGGYVTTAAPTYTTGQANPFSLTTAGLLRVDGTGGVFNGQSTSATAATTPGFAALSGGAVTTAAPTYTTGQLNGLSLDTSGNLRTLANQPTAANLNATIVGLGTAGTPSGGIVSVQGVAGGTTIPVSGTFTPNKSSTGTISSVAASATSVSLLASNASRVGASFYNDSTNQLYIALSASSASTTVFTIKIMPNSYFDLPVDYTGVINGVWNGVVGSVRVTEFT
jgi:hypothetical protein